jgi:F0F1-type ATP synthase assembly protein I
LQKWYFGVIQFVPCGATLHANKKVMNKIILRYGLYGSCSIILFFLATYLLFGTDTPNWDLQEVLGYLSMILSLLFVFFGIRHYRNTENGHQLSFGQGMKLGLFITLITSFAFGVFDSLFVTFFWPDFGNQYYGHYKDELAKKMSGAELTKALQEVDKQKEMFDNPLALFGFMFITVFLIGVIITVISSLILKTKTAKS